jgi:nucleotide-binding universal stress UspA family protein
VTENSAAPIVVGVDGSKECAVALDWAFAEAALRGCAVEAVTVSTVLDRTAELRSGTTRLADRTSAQIAAIAAGYPSVLSRHLCVLGSPAPALVRAARGAAMLVVGSHGAGAVARALLGSVSSYCTRNAECPVVIVSNGSRRADHVASTEDHVTALGMML